MWVPDIIKLSIFCKHFAYFEHENKNWERQMVEKKRVC